MIEIKNRDNQMLAVIAVDTLVSAELCRVRWPRADLRQADLQGANLWYAELLGAELTGANLAGADLRGAILSGVVLTGASLTGADLRGASLDWADLDGVDFTAANLSDAKLHGAGYDQATRWPSGFNPDEHGANRLGRPGCNFGGRPLSEEVQSAKPPLQKR